MAKYSYRCNKCDFALDVLRSSPPPSFDCPKCVGLGQMERAAKAPTARMVEVLDNGLMTRRVERPANAEQLYKERAVKSEIDKHKL